MLKYGQINGLEEYGGLGSAEVYPNPTKGQFSIHLPLGRSTLKVELRRIEIVDIVGNVLTKLCCEPGTMDLELDISRFPKGVYCVRLYVDHQMIVKKVIKL